MKKNGPFVSHEQEQIKEFRKHPRRATEYLNGCIEVAFEKDDPERRFEGHTYSFNCLIMVTFR